MTSDICIKKYKINKKMKIIKYFQLYCYTVTRSKNKNKQKKNNNNNNHNHNHNHNNNNNNNNNKITVQNTVKSINTIT